VDGTCECLPDYTECDWGGGWTFCADTRISASNCGECGHVCSGATPFCWDSVCVADCPADGTLCDWGGGFRYCVDAQNDPYNCGGCGSWCDAGDLCSNGACVEFDIAFGCDSCPCDNCGEDNLCCALPSNPAVAICVDADACP